MSYKRFAAILICALALTALVTFGVVGAGRGGNVPFADVRYFYLAAQLVRAGQSPYSFEAFKGLAVDTGLGDNIGVFPYPPHSLLLWVPLTWVPIGAARWAWTLANLLVLAIVAVLMGRWYAERSAGQGERDALASRAWIPAIIVGNPFTAHLVWTGQTGLLVLGCLLMAWYGLASGRSTLAGIFLGLASIKPQLSILVILWVVFTGNFRVLAVASATAAALLAFPLLAVGPGALTEWWQAAMAYQGEASGALAYNINLRSLLMGIGLPLPPRVGWVLPALAVLYVAAMAYRDRQQPFDHGDVLAALLAASLFLVYGRDYDLAVLAPLVPALWWHSRGKTAAKVFGLVILAMLFVPQRLISHAGVPLLPYWRIALLGMVWAWLTAAMWRASVRGRPLSHPTSHQRA